MARLSDRVVTGAPNGILSNDEPIQWYAADGITLIDGIKVDATDAVYLAPAGGLTKVGTGGFNLPNNTPLRGTTSSGGTARMVQMSATNVIEVGAAAQALELNATTTTVNSDLVVTGDIEASERVRLGNNKLLQARNQADTQWRSVLKVDTNNDLIIGSSSTPITLDVDTTVDGNLDVTGTTTGSGYLYLSSKTANQGLRLNNTTKIQAWNPAGTSLRDLMELDANEDVRIGSSANDIYLDNDTTVTGNLDVSGNIRQGTNPATAGDIRMAASSTIRNRNAANTNNIHMIGTNTSDQVTIAGSGQDTVVGADLGVTGDINAVGIIESGTYSNVGATSGCKIFQTGTVTISTTTTSTANRINFYNPNGLVGRIRTSGSTTSYVTTSDPRLKSEFTPITNASEMILEARDQGMIGEFHFLADPTQTVWGYNAHKLIDAQPNFGGSEGEGSRDAPLGDEVTPAGVDQSKRVPLLEAAIGELLDRIKVLEEAGAK